MEQRHKLFVSWKENCISVESYIILFVLDHCGLSNFEVFAIEEQDEIHKNDNTKNSDGFKCLTWIPLRKEKFQSFCFITEAEKNNSIKTVKLPALVSGDSTLTIVGLCGVIRFLIKAAGKNHISREFLGFRYSCLSAPSEVSIWTRFCEVESIDALKQFRLCIFPATFPKFENHLKHPVRTHNILKKVNVKTSLQSKTKVNGKNIIDDTLNIQNLSLRDIQRRAGTILDHKFAEGEDITISDLVLFSTFYLLMKFYKRDLLKKHFPAMECWYSLMETLCRDSISFVSVEDSPEKNDCVSIPKVNEFSLYSKDSGRSDKLGTCQSVLNKIFEKLSVIDVLQFKCKEELAGEFDWSVLPKDAHPLGGDLPPSRANRKCDQLQSIIIAVRRLAKPGDVLVDFCSGGGHLGIVLAFILPLCSVVLVDNKSESVDRARRRVERLQLKNVSLILGNVNYFIGNFDIGVTLHACGSATDRVLNKCIVKNANFVICPCCYGAVQPTTNIQYPQSKEMQDTLLTQSEYFRLAHSADQTHDKDNEKTPQGFKCMDLIDSDRALFASSQGYKVSLCKLKPENCSPKNNLIIGSRR
ncbi:hypothetical protein QYM36_011050 [Artemia franciscana]|uniref:Methyltransferase domain-containing protein n=2 Tax=Artemia franciscana TaxID=6661 RepID=A0AA88L8L9_ARTSF|nr:hypothetical protein QYM36_011050 [Artemia franciscana]